MLHRVMNKDKMKQAFKTGKWSTEKIEQSQKERVRDITFKCFN